MVARGRLIVAALVAAAILACASALFGGRSADAATPLPSINVSFAFSDLEPGVPQSQTQPVQLPETATVTDARWVSFDGLAASAAWTARLCGASGCHTVDPDLVGTALQAGAYTLTVEVTLRTMSPETTGTALGHIGLTSQASQGTLPATGSDLAWQTTALAAAALVAGAALAAFGGRTRRARR